ncbi:hypothetical protein DFH27DRAFT_523916 [Peziza echinospora]|nr:hypothetical protein DFH27DRAFT_523916 [Peziza echinospora]
MAASLAAYLAGEHPSPPALLASPVLPSYRHGRPRRLELISTTCYIQQGARAHTSHQLWQVTTVRSAHLSARPVVVGCPVGQGKGNQQQCSEDISTGGSMDADDEFGDFSGADAEALTAALAAAERRAASQSQKPTATPATPAAQASSSSGGTRPPPEGLKQQQPQQQQQQPAPVPAVQQPAPQKSLRTGPSAIIVNTRQFLRRCGYSWKAEALLPHADTQHAHSQEERKRVDNH